MPTDETPQQPLNELPEEIVKTVPDATMEERTCISCRKKFKPTRWCIIFDGKRMAPSACDSCADDRDYNMGEWARLCPIAFRLPNEVGGHTRLEKLDSAAPGWQKILEWEYGEKGLLIRGETGRGKTRAMWRLLRRMFDERRKIVWLSAAQFDRQCRDAGGNFTLTAWFERLANADVLFIDDLGKGAWTQPTEAQFFDLVDQRTREGRPILVTTNDSGDSLANRLSCDRGQPLIRRLRDYCETHVF